MALLSRRTAVAKPVAMSSDVVPRAVTSAFKCEADYLLDYSPSSSGIGRTR
jgi:hypothetical protein